MPLVCAEKGHESSALDALHLTSFLARVGEELPLKTTCRVLWALRLMAAGLLRGGLFRVYAC
jgi:hypothetical protein